MPQRWGKFAIAKVEFAMWELAVSDFCATCHVVNVRRKKMYIFLFGKTSKQPGRTGIVFRIKFWYQLHDIHKFCVNTFDHKILKHIDWDYLFYLYRHFPSKHQYNFPVFVRVDFVDKHFRKHYYDYRIDHGIKQVLHCQKNLRVPSANLGSAKKDALFVKIYMKIAHFHRSNCCSRLNHTDAWKNDNYGNKTWIIESRLCQLALIKCWRFAKCLRLSPRRNIQLS